MTKFEAAEINKISEWAQDEAIRIALLLAAYPVPPMPEFQVESNENSKESELTTTNFMDDHLKDDYLTEYLEEERKEFQKETLTDAEATSLCSEWKGNYSVIPGISWGDLPYDLQQRWLRFSCDYHLSESEEYSQLIKTMENAQLDDKAQEKQGESGNSKSKGSTEQRRGEGEEEEEEGEMESKYDDVFT